MKAFHLIVFLFPVATIGQKDITAGYKYHIDHQYKDLYEKHTDEDYKQHMIVTNVGYALPRHWRISVGTSFLTRQVNYAARKTYADFGSGWSPGGFYQAYCYARIRYSYLGLEWRISKYASASKNPGFQWGMSMYQHADLLVSYKESDKYLKPISGPNGDPWRVMNNPVYKMRKCFMYTGFDIHVRIPVKQFFIEPVAGMSFTLNARVRDVADERYQTGGEKRNIFFGLYMMPGFSCKIGYYFGGKKTE